MSFENLKLDARLTRAIAACHFKAPTAMQRQAIAGLEPKRTAPSHAKRAHAHQGARRADAQADGDRRPQGDRRRASRIRPSYG